MDMMKHYRLIIMDEFCNIREKGGEESDYMRWMEAKNKVIRTVMDIEFDAADFVSKKEDLQKQVAEPVAASYEIPEKHGANGSVPGIENGNGNGDVILTDHTTIDINHSLKKGWSVPEDEAQYIISRLNFMIKRDGRKAVETVLQDFDVEIKNIESLKNEKAEELFVFLKKAEKEENGKYVVSNVNIRESLKRSWAIDYDVAKLIIEALDAKINSIGISDTIAYLKKFNVTLDKINVITVEQADNLMVDLQSDEGAQIVYARIMSFLDEYVRIQIPNAADEDINKTKIRTLARILNRKDVDSLSYIHRIDKDALAYLEDELKARIIELKNTDKFGSLF